MSKKYFMRLLKVVLPLLLLAVIGIACSPQSTCPQLNGPAPDFTLEDLNGKQVSLSDYAGKDIVINFWATWCGYCKTQLPWIQEVYDKYADSGLTVLAVNIQESYQQASQYIEKQGFTFPVLLDKNGSVGQLYCIPALPATIFIDSKGTVKFGYPGAFRNVEEIEAALLYLQ